MDTLYEKESLEKLSHLELYQLLFNLSEDRQRIGVELGALSAEIRDRRQEINELEKSKRAKRGIVRLANKTIAIVSKTCTDKYGPIDLSEKLPSDLAHGEVPPGGEHDEKTSALRLASIPRPSGEMSDRFEAISMFFRTEQREMRKKEISSLTHTDIVTSNNTIDIMTREGILYRRKNPGSFAVWGLTEWREKEDPSPQQDATLPVTQKTSSNRVLVQEKTQREMLVERCERIKEFLHSTGNNSASTRDTYLAIGSTRDKAYNALRMLLKTGEVEKRSDGGAHIVWCLKSEELSSDSDCNEKDTPSCLSEEDHSAALQDLISDGNSSIMSTE